MNIKEANKIVESEVLKRIGLFNRDNLEAILGFEVRYNKEHVVFEVLDDKPINSKLIGSKAQGWRWRTNLEGKRNFEKPNLNLNLELPIKNPIKINGQKFFHRGHILAKEFAAFLPPSEIPKIKDSGKNGFIQFGVANMQQTKVKEGIFRHSQAFYENQIAEHLSVTSDKILYEVKIFFHDKTDKIPIGTKISFEIFEGNNSKNQLEKTSVFIPNFDSDFDLSNSSDYSGVDTYREFYKTGYTKKYETCFNHIASTDKEGRIRDDDGNQIFYIVSKNEYNTNELGICGIFLNMEDAAKAFGLDDIEKMNVEHYTECELRQEKYCPAKLTNWTGYYYPARSNKKGISAVFFDWDSVENIETFAMNYDGSGLKKKQAHSGGA